ncbi:MAG: hypothetical protein LBM41_01940 [Ruminococcus sp.]|nr:hypothetical protein [Ruminococcus sp.]
MKRVIDEMPDKVFNALVSWFISFLPDNDKIDYEELEDAELLRLVTERINSYGGWEEAKKHFISAEEFWSSLGVTAEDIENAEEDELI